MCKLVESCLIDDVTGEYRLSTVSYSLTRIETEIQMNRVFATYFTFNPENELSKIKKDFTRTLENYTKSLILADLKLPDLLIFTNCTTRQMMEGIEGVDSLKFCIVDDEKTFEMRERFHRNLVDGAKSMLSGLGLTSNAEADYLAVTHAKLYRLQDASRIAEKAEVFTWIDAGIFMPTHAQKHGEKSYEIDHKGRREVVYASSFDPREIFGREAFSEKVVTNASKSQLCGPAFTLTTEVISKSIEVSSELVDLSVKRFGFIPTEQCTYLLAFMHLGYRPKYVVRHYREIYRKILSGPRSSWLDSFLGRRLLSQYNSSDSWEDWR